jgi:hypothetical protein
VIAARILPAVELGVAPGGEEALIAIVILWPDAKSADNLSTDMRANSLAVRGSKRVEKCPVGKLLRLRSELWCGLGLLFVGVGLVLGVNSASAASGASYTIQRCIDPIVVDGNLKETSWATAAPSTLFRVWDGSAAPAALQVFAKMLWDDQNLYVAFIAKDPDLYGTYTGRDVKCWEQDNFEIFVTVPGTTGYVEVEGNLSGGFWDGYFTNVFAGPQGSYNMTNLQVAAHVDGTLNNASGVDNGFAAEIQLPFAEIYHGIPGGHPTNGSQLRLNLNRISWNTPTVLGGKGAAGSDTYYSWSPTPGTSPNFHQPTYFGTVTFSSEPVPAPVTAFDAPVLAGTNLILSGKGFPGLAYSALVSTNSALPLTNWTPILTNRCDAVSGKFTFTNPVDPANPQLFFRLLAR